MIQPKITREQVLNKVLTLYKPEQLKPVFVVGFRGYYLDSMGKPGINDRGIYDDCLCIVAPEYFQAFNANTDPSVYRAGIASLKPGIYPYRKGMHHIGKPNEYPAFRPATLGERVPVTRDGVEGPAPDGIAINIHKGGYNSTSSEGCQTIYPDQWLTFQGMMYKLLDQHNQTDFPYILIDWEN